MRLKYPVIHFSFQNSCYVRILPCFGSRLRTSTASFAITYYFYLILTFLIFIFICIFIFHMYFICIFILHISNHSLILIFTYHSDSALLLEFYFHSCIFPEIYLTILYSQTPNTFCRHYCLVHRFQNNYTINLPANPTVQLEKPRRSPLRLRFYTCTIEIASYAIGIVISETMY